MPAAYIAPYAAYIAPCWLIIPPYIAGLIIWAYMALLQGYYMALYSSIIMAAYSGWEYAVIAGLHGQHCGL